MTRAAEEIGGKPGKICAALEDSSPEWTKLIPEGEWEVYRLAIQSVQAAGVSFMLGGAFGLAAYTGRWRNTKDIDFYVLPADRERAINALTEAGFRDFYETLPYDRGWIYRAVLEGVIVDLIWGTPNRRSEVDSTWIAEARQLSLRNHTLEVVPAEELVWIKLYVLQRDRCDWPDVINLLYATSASLDWDRLVELLGEDIPLLYGALATFAWVCPNRVGEIPPNLRKRAGIRKVKKPAAGPDVDRIKLLDSRPWFAALQPCDRPMRL